MTSPRTEAQRARDTARVRDALRDAPEASEDALAEASGVDRNLVRAVLRADGVPDAWQRRAMGSDRGRSVFCEPCAKWRTVPERHLSVPCRGCGARLRRTR